MGFIKATTNIYINIKINFTSLFYFGLYIDFSLMPIITFVEMLISHKFTGAAKASKTVGSTVLLSLLNEKSTLSGAEASRV